MSKTYFSLDEYKKFVRDVNNIVGSDNLRSFAFDRRTGFIRMDANAYMNLLTVIDEKHVNTAIQLLNLIKTVPNYGDSPDFINLYKPETRDDANKFSVKGIKESDMGRYYPIITPTISFAYERIEFLEANFMDYRTDIFDEVFIAKIGEWYTVDKLKSFFEENTNDL